MTTRIYCPQSLNTEHVVLDGNAFHHLVQVLRSKAGDEFIIFNGQGGEYTARIQSIKKKQALIEIGSFKTIDNESPLKIHLGQGISRGDRMDYAIQKAVELGVHEITPVITQFSQLKADEKQIAKKLAHWEGIIISAAEQSGRCVIPTLYPPTPFAEWMAQPAEHKFICHPTAQSHHLKKETQSVMVAIGPEGGFHENEVQWAQTHQASVLSLGPRILRIETATVVALTLLQFCL